LGNIFIRISFICLFADSLLGSTEKRELAKDFSLRMEVAGKIINSEMLAIEFRVTELAANNCA